MKKSLMTFALVFAVAGLALAQQPSAPQGAGQAQPGASAQQKKAPEITNPAEYNAYMAAINSQDPRAKAQGLESFLTQYPNSVMKVDALEQLMRAYQGSGDIPKTLDAANRVLQADPNNVTALALSAYLYRMKAQSETEPQASQDMTQAGQFGQRGLQALTSYQKPENMSDLDFAKLKDQLAGIFNGSVGLASEFATKPPDYKKAKQFLQDAVNAQAPNDPTAFSLVYPLALAYLNDPQSTPQETVQGIWYVARATNLAPTPQAKASIGTFGQHKYDRYHGGDDGWTDVLAASASSPTPPAGWTIKPAPTPAEQAAAMVQQKTVAQMSFDEIQFVLTSGNQQAADTVWEGIKDKPLALGGGKVITVTPTEMTIAESYDDINATPPKADITLTMAGELPAKLIPKEGATIDFQGKPSEYTPNPFMMHLVEGALVKAKGSEPPPKTTPHHTTTHRKPS
jgi:tetratricopeptide (TPR) repeat protein